MKKFTKIETISLSRLNNVQFTQFLSEVEKLIQVATPEKLFIEPELFDAFAKNIKTLTQLAYENRANSQTKELVQLDKQRDEVIGYLFDMIRTERKSHHSQRQEAGKVLYETTKNYKGIANLPYREESLAVKALLEDFSKAKNTAHLTTLGLSESITLLAQLNTNFEAKMGDRMQEQVANVVGNSKQLRRESTEQYAEIVLRAQSQSVVNPSEQVTIFVAHLNRLIGDTILASKTPSLPSKPSETPAT